MNKYEKNVFINCPFDNYYFSLLHPLLFTIIYLGLNPRIALERANSGEPRFNKICELINKSKFGIHDLSKIKAKRRGEYFRLNMPFELGLDIGARIFNKSKHNKKICLILAEEKYAYQAALSDLSNSDIKHHDSNPIKVVECVRSWFAENGFKNIPSPTIVWYKFTDFMKDFYDKRNEEGFSDDDIYNMPIKETIQFMKEWRRKEFKMGKREKYHVLPDGQGNWNVQKEKAQRSSAKFEKKSDAVQKGREFAKNQELGQLIIHKKDGTIQTEYTYKKDPYPPKG